MEKLNEKGEVTEKGVSGIKEERKKILKGKYQNPSIVLLKELRDNHTECSDMASAMSPS